MQSRYFNRMEIVYPPVVALAKTMFRVLDLRIQIEGAHHIPAAGGAVLASNHASYLDFIFCGLGAQPAKRLVRFMAKKSVFDHKVSGPLMRGMRHIPVDRKAGTAAFQEAGNALRRGEVVGVFPEATISESFTVKALKSGAARLAEVGGVPLIPMAVWGPHRLWTKGRKKDLTQRHIPVIIRIGEPIPVPADATADETTVVLRRRLSALLDQVQRDYPDQPSGPDDRWWLPAHLGGTAPTPEKMGYPPRPEEADDSQRPGAVVDSPRPGAVVDSPRPGAVGDPQRPGAVGDPQRPGAVGDPQRPGATDSSPRPESAARPQDAGNSANPADPAALDA